MKRSTRSILIALVSSRTSLEMVYANKISKAASTTKVIALLRNERRYQCSINQRKAIFCRGLSKGNSNLCNYSISVFDHLPPFIYSHHRYYFSIHSKVLHAVSSATLGSKCGRYFFVVCPIVFDFACTSISRRINMECIRKQSVLPGTGLHDLRWVDRCSAVQLLIVHILPHCRHIQERQKRRQIHPGQD